MTQRAFEVRDDAVSHSTSFDTNDQLNLVSLTKDRIQSDKPTAVSDQAVPKQSWLIAQACFKSDETQTAQPARLRDRILHEAQRWVGHSVWRLPDVTERIAPHILQFGRVGCAATLSALLDRADNGKFEGVWSARVSDLRKQLESAGWVKSYVGLPGYLWFSSSHCGVLGPDKTSFDNSSTTRRLETRPLRSVTGDQPIVFLKPPEKK